MMLRLVGCIFLLLMGNAWAQSTSWTAPEAVIRATREVEAPTTSVPRRLTGESKALSPALQELLQQTYTGTRSGDLVAIRIVFKANVPEGLQPTLERLGGVFETSWVNTAYARLAARQVQLLAHAFEEIVRIEPQAFVDAQSLPVVSQSIGMALPAKLRALQQRAHGGRGIRIGILDFGFSGYVAAGLPTPLNARVFSPGAQVFAGSEHGTQCAALIHQIAPEASLVLASVGDGGKAGEGQVLAAAQWLATQGVQFVNISASGYVSALDGSAPLDQLINQQSATGSIWVVAAGNQALTHWRGAIADTNHNGWVDLGLPERGDLLVFEVTQPRSISIALNWTPWDGHGADLDAFLYAVQSDGKAELLAQADTLQPSGAVRPVETLTRTLPAGFYLLGIRTTRLEHPGVVNVFVSGAAHLSPALSTGSVGSPGTAQAALTVGVAEGHASAVFSSRGPTEDGRSKPEILVPSIASNFVGTSAAAPVITGIAALLQAGDGGHGRAHLERTLRQSAQAAQDASAVWGVLDLDAVQAGLQNGKPNSAKWHQ
jgi:hypothetical protein